MCGHLLSDECDDLRCSELLHPLTTGELIWEICGNNAYKENS